jgi:hypothetical protein
LQLFDAYLIFASSAGAYLSGGAYGGNLGRQDHALIKKYFTSLDETLQLIASDDQKDFAAFRAIITSNLQVKITSPVNS